MAKIKGQSSLEFMMTYGWAIIIIATASVVAWQMGLFNPSGSIKPSSLGFWGVRPFIGDTRCIDNGSLTIPLQNTISEGINVTKINVTVDGITYPNQYTPPLSLSMGTITPVDISGLPLYGAGSSFRIFVSICYTDDRMGPGVTFRSSGVIRGTVEMA